jgi:hypothetical protein
VVGDWDGDGTTTVGVVDPRSETWYLHNFNMQGAPDYTPFTYGAPGWMPLAGNWRGIATGLHTITTPLALDHGMTDAALYAIATANPALLGSVQAAPSAGPQEQADIAPAGDGAEAHGTGGSPEFPRAWTSAADSDELQVKLG